MERDQEEERNQEMNLATVDSCAEDLGMSFKRWYTSTGILHVVLKERESSYLLPWMEGNTVVRG